MTAEIFLRALVYRGHRPSARWEVTITVRRDDDGLDFSGPFVRADPPLGLAWIRLTDSRGNPVCARVRPPANTWSAGSG